MPAYLSSNSSLPPQHHHVSPLSNDSPSNSAENKLYLKHAAHAVRCFAKALMCSPGSRLEDTLRLMQLWFDHGDDKDQDVYFALTETIFDLPVTTWLEAIPQLMARLDCPDDQKSVQLVLRVLCEIARHRPQAVIYALTVASRSKDVHRSKNAGTVLEKMMEYHSKLVREVNIKNIEQIEV